MAYYTEKELKNFGFKDVGKNVKISKDTRFYRPEKMVVGNDVRIDDFCILSGKITIGDHVHIAVYSYLSGCDAGITLGNYSGLAYGCRVFTDSDDYSGLSMTNPTIPDIYKPKKVSKAVLIGEHCILGVGCVVMPGVEIGQGSAFGVYSFVTKSVDSWGLYVGNPAKKIKNRSREILELCADFERTK